MNEINVEKKFLLTICLFFINLLLPNIFSIFSLKLPISIQLFFSLIVLFLFLNIYKNDYKKSLQEFFNKPFKYIGIVFLSFIIYFVLNIIIDAAISYGLNISVPNNSSSDILYRLNPLYFIILTIFISPIIESTFIPLSFHKILSNKFFYYVICSFLYGMLYVVFSLKNPLQLFYILSYAILGFIISYLYNKYENIILPIMFKIISGVLFLLTYLI